MLEYEGGIVFNVLGTRITLYSEELHYGINTVVSANNQYYYLGEQIPNIETIVCFWEELNNRKLDQQELDQVMIDNNLKSQAI